MNDDHWTYREWEDATVEKIVVESRSMPSEHRDDWLRLQMKLAIQQALRHGRAGLSDGDPVAS